MMELYAWSGESVVESRPPAKNWLDAFRALRRLAGDRRVAALRDEFLWAVESAAAKASGARLMAFEEIARDLAQTKVKPMR